MANEGGDTTLAPRRQALRAGELNGMAELTAKEVTEMRDAHAKGESRTAIALRYSMDRASVNQILARRRWKHVPMTEAEVVFFAKRDAIKLLNTVPTKPLVASCLYPHLLATEDGDVWLEGTRRLPQHVSSSGYMSVSYRLNSKAEATYVHRVVASAFYPDADFSLAVDHADGDRRNNHYTNLSWVTYQENTRRANVAGRISRGEACWNAKLCAQDVDTIRQELAGGAPAKAVATRFGVGVEQILRIADRRAWKHI